MSRRERFLTVRLTQEELGKWKAKSAATGRKPSELVREAMERTRTWTARAAGAERERVRQVARIGNNLNQIARWANTHKGGAEAVEVIAHLAAIEREIGELARGSGEEGEDAH